MARPTKPSTPETEPETQAASPPVTFDVNDPAFQQIVAQAVAARLAAMEADKPAMMTVAGKSERSIRNELLVRKAFKKAGFGDVVPHTDVKTFNRWMAAGFRPVEGSKSLKVANLRLFCRAQVRQLTAEEKAGMKAQSAAAVRRHNAKIIQIAEAGPQ